MEQMLKIDKNGMYYYETILDEEDEEDDAPEVKPDPLKRNIK